MPIRGAHRFRAIGTGGGGGGAVAPTVVSTPSINGTPTEGVSLTYTAGTYLGSGITITRQLQIEGPPGTWVDIPGAVNPTYTPVVGQATHDVRLVEIAHNAGGDSPPNYSAPKTVAVAPAAVVVSKATLFTNLAMFDTSHLATNDRPDYETAHPTIEGTLINHAWVSTHGPNNFSNSVVEFIPTSPTTGTAKTVVPWEQYTTDTTLSAPPYTDKIPPRGELDATRGDFGPGALQPGFNKHTGTTDNKPTGYFDKTRTSVWFGEAVATIGDHGALGAYIRGYLYPQTQHASTYALSDDQFSGGELFNPGSAICTDLNWVVFYGNLGGTGEGYPSFDLRIFKYTGDPSAPWSSWGSTYSMVGTGLMTFSGGRNHCCCIGKTLYLGGGHTPWDGITPSGVNLVGPDYPGTSSTVFTWVNHCYEDGQELPVRAMMESQGIPDHTIGYAVNCTANTFSVSLTKGGPPLNIGTGVGWLDYAINTRLWAVNLDPDGTGTLRPTVELVSTRFANQSWGTTKEGRLMVDNLRNRLIFVQKKVTAFDIATRTWSDIDVEGWSAQGEGKGYGSVQGFHSAEFDTVFFRGSPVLSNDAVGGVPWEFNSIVFPPYRAQVGNPLTAGDDQDQYIDGTHRLTWDHTGGDYKNSLGAEQDTASPYGTVTVINICAPGGTAPPEDLTIDITSMLDELFEDNTGIYLRQIGGDRQTRFVLRGHPTEPATRMIITKVGGGVLNPTLLTDTILSPPFSYAQSKWQGTALVKFGIEALGVTRAECASASLVLRHFEDFFGGSAATIGAYLLNPPLIKDIPQTVGSETAGSADPAIKIWCNGDASGHIGFSDIDTIVADSSADGWWPPGQTNCWNGTNNVDLFPLPRHVIPDGRGGLRITQAIGLNAASSAIRYFQNPSDLADTYGDGPHPAPNEFYSTYTIQIPFLAGESIANSGEKLPGPEGSGDNSNSALPYDYWSLRMEHGQRSPANPWHLKFFTYLYDPAIYGPGAQSGLPVDVDKPNHFLMRRGRTYTISQYFKRNTFSGATPNADGIYELYVNWVYMPNGSLHNHVFALTPKSALYEFFLMIYCGGDAVSTRNADYTVSNIMVTTALPARNNPLLRYIRQN